MTVTLDRLNFRLPTRRWARGAIKKRPKTKLKKVHFPRIKRSKARSTRRSCLFTSFDLRPLFGRESAGKSGKSLTAATSPSARCPSLHSTHTSHLSIAESKWLCIVSAAPMVATSPSVVPSRLVGCYRERTTCGRARG